VAEDKDDTPKAQR